MKYLVLLSLMFSGYFLKAQTITPTQTDEIIIDNGTPDKADPGDRIRYKVTISETGNTTDANGVQLNVTPDMLTAFVAGSFKSSPLAIEDAYPCTGNVPIMIAAPGVMSNDFDDSPAMLMVSIATAQATTRGGLVDIFSDGSFRYTPPVGYEGDDSFTYILNDATQAGPSASLTDMGTVTISISNMIWLINSASVAATADGRLDTPFKTLAAFNAVNGGNTMNNGDVSDPAVNEVIFLYSGSSNYINGIPLLNGQKLFGQGASIADLATLTGISFSIHSVTLPMAGGTSPAVTNGAGDGVRLASNNTIRGLNIGNCASFAINDNGNIGTLNLTEIGISNTTGGGLQTDGGGTINFTGNGNTISTTTNTAVNISNTTIGGSGVTLQSIAMNGSSTSNTAIILENTGAGPFTVTGLSTTNGSGGTIQNILADAVKLKNVGGRVTLKNNIIQDIGTTTGAINTQSGHDAIHSEMLNGGLAMDNVIIRRISDNAILGRLFTPIPLPSPGGGAIISTVFNGLEIINCLIEDTNRFHIANVGDDSDEGSIRIIGLTGTVLIKNSTIRKGGELLDIQSHTSGTLNMTIQGSTFDKAFKEFTSGGTAKVGKSGIDINILGSTDATIIIGDPSESNPALGNSFTDCATASMRILTTLDNTATIIPTGSSTATVSYNTFLVTDHSSALSTDGNFPQGGVLFRTGNGAGTLNAIFSHNTFGSFDGMSTSDECMNADGGTGNLVLLYDTGGGNVRINNNTFNGSINAAWWFTAEQNATATILVKENIYRSNPNFFSPDPSFGTFNVPGIPSEARVRNNGVMNLTIKDEDHAPHELRTATCCCGGCNEQTIRFTTQSSGGTLNLHGTNVDSPNGFDLTRSGGSFNLYKGISSSSDPQTIFADNLCTGGGTAFGGNPGQTPPTVEVNGTITTQNGTPALPGI